MRVCKSIFAPWSRVDHMASLLHCRPVLQLLTKKSVTAAMPVGVSSFDENARKRKMHTGAQSHINLKSITSGFGFMPLQDDLTLIFIHFRTTDFVKRPCQSQSIRMLLSLFLSLKLQGSFERKMNRSALSKTIPSALRSSQIYHQIHITSSTASVERAERLPA